MKFCVAMNMVINTKVKFLSLWLYSLFVSMVIS